jgi:ACS family tartrate transporter-like MFS transporter
MTKSMWRILPLILLAYLMAYMDRVNISFASLQMNDELKFSASVYGFGAGLFFLAYALFEVPSSLMLRRYSAPQWISRIMITWGLLSAGMIRAETAPNRGGASSRPREGFCGRKDDLLTDE